MDYVRSVRNLGPPDLFYLDAASGWIDLGNYAEANAELDNIQPRLRVHPEVLKLRWQIYAAAKKWDDCVGIAEAVKQAVPKNVFGHVHLSYALHELGRTREAFDQLKPALDRFPKDHVIRYNLACYSASLGNLPAAKAWLRVAIALSNTAEVKAMALDDPDLATLWQYIKKL